MTRPDIKNRLIYILILLFVVQCIFFIVLLFQIKALNQKVFNTNRLVIEKLINNEKEELDIEINLNDIILGDENAPLTLYMFSNYSCSACIAFFKDTYPEIEKQFINTGKLRFVLKQIVPKKSIGTNFISRAAICAYQQKKFPELHNYLTQSDMMPDSGQVVSFISKQSSLDMELFDKCLNDKKLTDYIIETNKHFRKHRIKGTPAFILNDSLFVGSKSYSKFEKIINYELNQVNN